MYQPIAVLCCAYNCALRIDLIDMRGHLDSSEENQKDQDKKKSDGIVTGLIY